MTHVVDIATSVNRPVARRVQVVGCTRALVWGPSYIKNEMITNSFISKIWYLVFTIINNSTFSMIIITWQH